MNSNWPYDLQHLIAYVENKLSAEEDMELAKSLQKDEQLRMIVEGIEWYQMSESEVSLEEYLQESRKELWNKLASYSAQKKTELSGSEKSFKFWILEKKLHLPALALLLLYGLVLGLFLKNTDLEIPKLLKQSTYIFQVLVLIIATIFFLKTEPKILSSPKYYRATLARRQMWGLFRKLTFSWIFLYVALIIFSIEESIEYAILIFNTLNNLTIVYLYLCYHCLNTESIDVEEKLNTPPSRERVDTAIEKPIQTKKRWGLSLVVLCLILEYLLILSFPESKQDFHLLFGIISGLVCMAFTTQLVGRIGSKFLSKEKVAIICLSFYAGIQPLLVFIFPVDDYTLFSGAFAGALENIISMGLVFYALFGKILLLAFVAWSIDTNRIIKYLIQSKALADQGEETELIEINEDLALEHKNIT